MLTSTSAWVRRRSPTAVAMSAASALKRRCMSAAIIRSDSMRAANVAARPESRITLAAIIVRPFADASTPRKYRHFAKSLTMHCAMPGAKISLQISDECSNLVSFALAQFKPFALSPPESRLAPFQKRLDAFLVVFAHARQRKLVDVHVARQIVERVRQTINRQLGHGDRERRVRSDPGGVRRHGLQGLS